MGIPYCYECLKWRRFHCFLCPPNRGSVWFVVWLFFLLVIFYWWVFMKWWDPIGFLCFFDMFIFCCPIDAFVSWRGSYRLFCSLIVLFTSFFLLVDLHKIVGSYWLSLSPCYIYFCCLNDELLFPIIRVGELTSVQVNMLSSRSSLIGF